MDGAGRRKGLAAPLGFIPEVRVEDLAREHREVAEILFGKQREKVRARGIGAVRSEADRLQLSCTARSNSGCLGTAPSTAVPSLPGNSSAANAPTPPSMGSNERRHSTSVST